MVRGSVTVPAAVLARFGVHEHDAVIEPLGRGHIHQTYLVSGAATPFVLQRLNETAFPDPGRLERARNQLALHRDLTARENELRPHVAG